MGDTYIKTDDGVWTKANRPYVRINELWTPVKETWVKQSGVWGQSWDYNPNPPSIPEISLQIIDSRYIRIGVRLPDTLHDPTVRRFRVLASNTAAPTTPTGKGEITGNDSGWPNEDWSNWWFNGAGGGTSDHTTTQVFTYKKYPLNPTDKTNLPGGQRYYFAAWAEDFDGNISAGQFTNIWMPKDGKKTDNVLSKEANITVDGAGSIDATGVYTTGLIKAHDAPRSDGVWFYNDKITSLVGVHGAPTITTAQIRVTRMDDIYQPSATVRVGWHAVGAPGNVDPASFQKSASIGSVQKGETKWLDLPSSWYGDFNTSIKGIALKHGPSVSDDLELKDLSLGALRCGELHLIWTEAL